MNKIISSLLLVLTFCNTAHSKAPKKTDVLIIGAGLSGLATAYELRKAGISYHILELTPRIGGRVRTITYHLENGDQISADSGMEEYWESNPAVKVIQELKLPVSHDEAASSIFLNGKFYEFDVLNSEAFLKKIFNESELTALQGFKAKVQAMIPDLKKNPIPESTYKLKDISFSNWVAQTGVPPKVSEWIRVSVECEAGTEWTRFSALDGIDEFRIFLGGGEQSYRVIGGNEKFTDALAKHVGRENITTNARVSKVVKGVQFSTINYYDQVTNHRNFIQAKYVVSTVPLYRLGMEVQFEPALSAQKVASISSQTYGSYFKAHVFVPEEASKFWSKNGNSILPILSDSELGVIYFGNPDQKSKTKIISLLVTGARAEAFNFMNEDQTRSMITKGFDRIWPGFSKMMKGMEFYRFHPRAIASWPVGRSRFDDLSNEIRKPENNIYFAGDFTESSHSSGAFESAARVSSQIIALAKKGKK